MSAVDKIVSRFQQSGRQLELEVRFSNVDFDLFEMLMSSMIDRADAGQYSTTHSRTLNSIHTRSDYGIDRRAHVQYIREISFLPDGERKNEYRTKTRVDNIAHVKTGSGTPSYRISLAQEKILDKEFAAENLLFRFKNRVSFASLKKDNPLYGWRLDMTIVRELTQRSVNYLSPISKEFFLLDNYDKQTEKTLLSSLLLVGDDVPTATRISNQQKYKYEIELEYVGSAAELTSTDMQNAVKEILRIINPDYLLSSQMQTEIERVASLFIDSPSVLQKYSSGEWGLKQLGPQAIAPTRGQYAEIYPPIGYYLTDKAHGVHAMAVVYNNELKLIAPGLVPPLMKWKCEPTAKTSPYTVVEGEAVLNSDGSLLFLTFDVLSVKGENITSKPFEERLRDLAQSTAIVEAVTLGEWCGESEGVSIRVQPKPFIHLASSDSEELSKQFSEMYYREDRGYEIDGQIMYAPGSNYESTQILKWKPVEEITNDFLVRRPPKKIMGIAPFIDMPGHTLYFLFVGISREAFQRFGMEFCRGYKELFPAFATNKSHYFPIQFQPSDQPFAYLYQHPNDSPIEEVIENRIVEMRLKSADGADGTSKFPGPAWEVVRVRTDRDEDLKKGRLFGNNYKTAEMNWLNYRDPFPFEMLGEGPNQSYFNSPNSGIYSAPNAFVSFCKASLVREKVAGRGCVVDLGAGRGADIGRYVDANIPIAVMVDNDSAALAELVRRKHSHMERRRNKPSKGRTLFHVQKGDFTMPYELLVNSVQKIPGFPSKGADCMVSFLAAHYAFSKREGIANLSKIAAGLVRPGGVVILTLLDGAKVFELLKDVPVGESWIAREGGSIKYAVRKQYKQDKLTTSGQEIGVMLPFSGKEYYTEYLSNFDEIEKSFKARGFDLVFRRNLWDNYESGFKSQRNHYENITEEDKQWLGLMGALAFVKS